MLNSKNLIRTIAWLAVSSLISHLAYSIYKNQLLRAERETASEGIRTGQINALTSSLREMVKRHEANDKCLNAVVVSKKI